MRGFFSARVGNSSHVCGGRGSAFCVDLSRIFKFSQLFGKISGRRAIFVDFCAILGQPRLKNLTKIAPKTTRILRKS